MGCGNCRSLPKAKQVMRSQETILLKALSKAIVEALSKAIVGAFLLGCMVVILVREQWGRARLKPWGGHSR
jgi:hypothetical protein